MSELRRVKLFSVGASWVLTLRRSQSRGLLLHPEGLDGVQLCRSVCRIAAAQQAHHGRQHAPKWGRLASKPARGVISGAPLGLSPNPPKDGLGDSP